MLIGAVCSVAGQVGDLFESKLKRKADVKDAGSLFPGHGGMMDRIDALIWNKNKILLIYYYDEYLT